jgi:hypothetical protein
MADNGDVQIFYGSCSQILSVQIIGGTWSNAETVATDAKPGTTIDCMRVMPWNTGIAWVSHSSYFLTNPFRKGYPNKFC